MNQTTHARTAAPAARCSIADLIGYRAPAPRTVWRMCGKHRVAVQAAPTRKARLQALAVTAPRVKRALA